MAIVKKKQKKKEIGAVSLQSPVPQILRKVKSRKICQFFWGGCCWGFTSLHVGFRKPNENELQVFLPFFFFFFLLPVLIRIRPRSLESGRGSGREKNKKKKKKKATTSTTSEDVRGRNFLRSTVVRRPLPFDFHRQWPPNGKVRSGPFDGQEERKQHLLNR